MGDEQDKLREIMRLGTEMTQIKDLDLLMERILTEARRFVNGDAGTIYLKVDDNLEFTYTQNETLRRRLPEGKKLIYNTFSLPIDHATIAGYVAATGLALNIPDVGELSPDLPYKFGIEFDEVADYHTQSMFTLPLKTVRNDIVGVLQVINAQNEAGETVSFSDEDMLLIRHFATSAATALERAQMTRTFFLRMIRMTELRDPKETAPHVIRVAAYSTELYEVWARAQGMAERDIERQRDVLRLAAMLHDMGKVGIADHILKNRHRSLRTNTRP